MSKITAFAIAPSQNKPEYQDEEGKIHHPHDATGGFILGAQQFATAYNCPFRMFNNYPIARRPKEFLGTIEAYCPGGTNLFAYFGHGVPHGINTAGMYEKNLDDFLKVLKPKISYPFVAVLYACSAGQQGGFTGKLRERLGGDVWVYGHTTIRHAFMSPDVSEEASGNSPTWRMLYPSGSALRDAWADALHYTDLWLRFPQMESDAIDAEVNAWRLLGTWEVNTGGQVRQYEFHPKNKYHSKANPWSLQSGRAINEAPAGTVKVFGAKQRSGPVQEGTWVILDKLYINWNSGAEEAWEEAWHLPLKLVGQQGIAGGTWGRVRDIAELAGPPRLTGGTTLSAKRLSHSREGYKTEN